MALGRVTTEVDSPGACTRCGGKLKADGKTYCAACQVIPGGEIDAARDDRSTPEEDEEGEKEAGDDGFTVGDVDKGVQVRTGITVPARFARMARR